MEVWGYEERRRCADSAMLQDSKPRNGSMMLAPGFGAIYGCAACAVRCFGRAHLACNARSWRSMSNGGLPQVQREKVFKCQHSLRGRFSSESSMFCRRALPVMFDYCANQHKVAENVTRVSTTKHVPEI